MEDIDKIIGQRLRRRRKDLRFSQSDLGRLLGISFSQIQKHENASTKIGAGRLYEIAHHLEMPVEFFFCDADFASLAPPKQELELMREAFHAIEEPRVKEKVLELVCSIAAGQATRVSRAVTGKP